MATQYYGIEKGLNVDQVTTGSSTTGKTVEVTVDLADGATREQVMIAIEAIKVYIGKNIWPPA